jgi:hypothetical protein
MNAPIFRVLSLLGVTVTALNCAKKEPSPPSAPTRPATVLTPPPPPSTAPVQGKLTDEQWQEVIQRRREQAKLRQEQRRLVHPRPHPSTTAPVPTTWPG